MQSGSTTSTAHSYRRIADGRPYLLGDYVTLSDLALATAAAPLLLPDGYRSPIPKIEVMPAPMQLPVMVRLSNLPVVISASTASLRTLKFLIELAMSKPLGT